MRNLLNIGLIILLILYSCNKEDNNLKKDLCPGGKSTSFINSADLQNCKFRTNSYWVFFDSVNNSFDSVSIEIFKQEFVKDGCGNSFETHSFKTISTNSSESTNYVVVAGGLFKDFDGTANSGTEIYGDFSTTKSMTNFQIEKFDSLFIFDQYYKKVLRVEIEKDNTENNHKSIYFINSEFGFLRHDIYSENKLTSRKMLVRKNIVK